jgi:hypothetical protein
MSTAARRTVAARREAQHDFVAGFDAAHTCADLLDNTRALMTENAEQRERHAARPHREVRVAQARGHQANEHLVVAQIGGVHLERRTIREVRPAQPLSFP